MSKRKLNIHLQTVKKKTSSRFKEEWLSELIETDTISSSSKQIVKLGDIFIYKENGEVVCIICSKAKATGEFSAGKKWDEWKLDYLKRHTGQKCHIDSVIKLRSQNSGGILRMLKETVEDRDKRLELNERKKSPPDMVKVLIDNVILAVKMNASMLSVQDIHDHVAKYIKVPECWRSKNYAFEFVNCISSVLQDDLMTELRESTFHTLIIDESTDISVQKMLIMYFKYRPRFEISYKTIFGGIIKLTSCDSKSLVQAIRKFYVDNCVDLQKMVMVTSDGAPVMLGKNDGVAAILKREVHHLCEQHCVAHREDLGIDDAWKQVSLMQDIETLLKTVYAMFSRSSVKQGKFDDLVTAAECDAVAFRPLNEVRWLSRYFAVSAFMRNYNMLIDYCTEQVNMTNDPICKYCLTKLQNPQIRLALTILNDVLGELTSLCKCFQKSNLSTIEAFQFAKAKISKLKSQYLGRTVYWSDAVKKVITEVGSDVSTAAILRFMELLCQHLDKRFPDNELAEWQAFDHCIIAKEPNFDFGKENVKRLIIKFSRFMPKCDENAILKICEQYADFKFLIAEKVKAGSIQTFQDVVSFVLKNEDMTELSFLLDICGTFQASSADCERGFSLMNSIKTKSRNRLQVDHLYNLMSIKFFLLSGGNINLNAVYKHWITHKDRREKAVDNKQNDI